jgi:riboflavin synthase
VFTGLIQDIGELTAVDRDGDGARLRIETRLASQVALGDSVAVDGVCLTATAIGDSAFETEAMNQTLNVTALGGIEQGARVNLELAMQPSDRFGGHIVQGHVDGVAEILEVTEDGFARRIRASLPESLLRYAIDKGSITLAGVSLTVAELGPNWVEVSLIPETLERTTFGAVEPGRKLNVECDVVAKYVERIVGPLAGKEPA